MKRAILKVSPQYFVGAFRQDEIHVKVTERLPDDAKYISCHYYVERDLFLIVIESEEFEDIREGGIMPYIKDIMFSELVTSVSHE